MLLESTPEKLLQSKEQEILENHTNVERCYFFIDKIDDVKKITFLYICLFLRELRMKNTNNRQNQNEDVICKKNYEHNLNLYFKIINILTFIASLFGQVFFKSFEKNRGAFKIFVHYILQNNRTFEEFARSRLYT